MPTQMNLPILVAEAVEAELARNPEKYRSVTPGPKGDSLTLVSVVTEADFSLTMTFSDGTVYHSPPVRGLRGEEGEQGVRGPRGVSIHHTRWTATTNPEHHFGVAGHMDTYTLYGDEDELVVLGWFSVKNGEDGKDSYDYAVEGGYEGTKEEFYKDIAENATNIEQIRNLVSQIEHLFDMVENKGQEFIDQINQIIEDFLAMKGAPGGFAELDENGKVPVEQIPDEVRGIIRVNTHAELPISGVPRQLYLVVQDETAEGASTLYHWAEFEYRPATSSTTVLGLTELRGLIAALDEDKASRQELNEARTELEAVTLAVKEDLEDLTELVGVSNDFTDDEKEKLANLGSYGGTHASYDDLVASTDTSKVGEGSYAAVDPGAGEDAILYFWDETDQKWVRNTLDGKTIKELYEAEDDTNAFTDGEKTKLASVDQLIEERYDEAFEVAKDGSGFTRERDAQLIFDAVNATVSIAPGLGKSTWFYYRRGRKIESSETLTHTLSEAEKTNGGFYLSFNDDGDLVNAGPYPDFYNTTLCFYVHYSNGEFIIEGDERHGADRDTAWHLSHHREDGMVVYTLGSIDWTADDADNVGIQITSTLVADEDLQHLIKHSPTGEEPFSQILEGSQDTVRIPTLYYDGSIRYLADKKLPWVADALKYNDGVTLKDVPDGKFVNYFLVASHCQKYPIKLIMGRKLFDSDDETVDETLESLGLNFPEMALLYRISLERDNSLSTVGKCKLKSVQQAASRITFESSAGSTSSGLSNHAQLLGRNDDNAHPMSSITGLQEALGSINSTVGGAFQKNQVVQSVGDSITDVMSQKTTTDAIANIPSVPKSTSYTVVLADKGKSIDTSADVTIPPNVFAVGDTFVVTSTTAGEIRVIPGVGVTIRHAGTEDSGTAILGSYGVTTLRMVTNNNWRAIGMGMSV